MTSNKLSNPILIWVVALLSIATIIIIASPKLRSSGKQHDAQRLTEVPKVISKVKDLEVVGVTIEGQGGPDAIVAIEIRNNSDKPIIAVAVESGDEKDSKGISTDGFQGGDEPPTIILLPHGTITMRMAAANLLAGKPLKVAGVMYLDGTEDGEELARNSIRGHRDQAKAKGSAKKGEPQQ